jgi:hypothetical protein
MYNLPRGAYGVLHRTIEGNDIGLDNPLVFILSDQNFPLMVLVGAGGEFLKVIQDKNGSLIELVELFLGLIRGLDVLAGSVVLLASASYVTVTGMAEYTAEFVGASGVLRDAFAGSISLMHGIPFLIGCTKNTPAIRALAEIVQWVHITTVGSEDISAMRRAFASSLRSGSPVSTHQQLIRLPITQSGGERVPFIVTGFDNLKTAVEPVSEEEEKTLLVLLLEELNSMYPVNLDVDIVCDRVMARDVFDERTTHHTDLVLTGASYLANIAGSTTWLPRSIWTQQWWCFSCSITAPT